MLPNILQDTGQLPWREVSSPTRPSCHSWDTLRQRPPRLREVMTCHSPLAAAISSFQQFGKYASSSALPCVWGSGLQPQGAKSDGSSVDSSRPNECPVDTPLLSNTMVLFNGPLDNTVKPEATGRKLIVQTSHPAFLSSDLSTKGCGLGANANLTQERRRPNGSRVSDPPL